MTVSSRKPKWRPPGQEWVSPPQTAQVWLRDNNDSSTTAVVLRVSPDMAVWAGVRGGKAWDGVHMWEVWHPEAWNLWIPLPREGLIRGFREGWRRRFVRALREDGARVVHRVPVWRAADLWLGRTPPEE